MPVSMYGHHMSAWCLQVQRRMSGSLELGFQVVMRPLLRVLGAEPGSSGTTVSAVNDRTISSAPKLFLNITGMS